MSKYNGCIFLISSRVKVLKECLRLLFLNYNHKYSYPVLVFYFDNIYNEGFIKDIHQSISHNIQFIPIDYKIPEHLKESDLFYNRDYLSYVRKCFPKSRLGYLHAITWKSNFSNNKLLQQYDWSIMIDDDSFFTKPINFDFFEILDTNNCYFGSAYTKTEVYPNERDCRQQLHNFTKQFCTKHNIIPKNKILKKFLNEDSDIYLMGPKQRKIENTPLTWNCGNCNIFNMKMFRTDTWKKWNQEFNDSGGGYLHRWGDIEVIGLYAHIFLDKPLYDFRLIEQQLFETGNTSWLRVGTAPGTLDGKQ